MTDRTYVEARLKEIAAKKARAARAQPCKRKALPICNHCEEPIDHEVHQAWDHEFFHPMVYL